MLRKILSIGLAFTLIVTLCSSSFAYQTKSTDKNHSINEITIKNIVKDITKDEAENLSLEELKYAAKIANTDKDARTIFDALVNKAEQMQVALKHEKQSGDTSMDGLVNSSTQVIETYLNVTGVTKVNQTVTIRYNIIAKIPSGVSLKLGYEFPTIVRTSGASENQFGKSIGAYTKSYNIPDLMCQSRIIADLIANTYSEKKVYSTYNYSSPNRYTDYHEVSTAEVAGYWTVYVAVPGLSAKYAPKKLLQLVGKTISIGNTSWAVLNSVNINLGVPVPIKGHYYKTETWYSNNKLYTKVSVWQTKTKFLLGETPMYASEYPVNINMPSF